MRRRRLLYTVCLLYAYVYLRSQRHKGDSGVQKGCHCCGRPFYYYRFILRRNHLGLCFVWPAVWPYTPHACSRVELLLRQQIENHSNPLDECRFSRTRLFEYRRTATRRTRARFNKILLIIRFQKVVPMIRVVFR